MRGKKNQMKSKLGMRLSHAKRNNITVSYWGKTCKRYQVWQDRLLVPNTSGKKTLTYGKNCGNLIQVGLTCALD